MDSRLYVGNLAFGTTEQTLREVFAAGGRAVARVSIITDRETGRPRGFAFVQMATEDDARAAIEALDGRPVDGRPLRVNLAQSRPPAGPSPEGRPPRGPRDARPPADGRPAGRPFPSRPPGPREPAPAREAAFARPPREAPRERDDRGPPRRVRDDFDVRFDAPFAGDFPFDQMPPPELDGRGRGKGGRRRDPKRLRGKRGRDFGGDDFGEEY